MSGDRTKRRKIAKRYRLDRAFGYERRLRGEQEDAETLERDLESASRYVQMLLPQPVGDGPVRAA